MVLNAMINNLNLTRTSSVIFIKVFCLDKNKFIGRTGGEIIVFTRCTRSKCVCHINHYIWCILGVQLADKVGMCKATLAVC